MPMEALRDFWQAAQGSHQARDLRQAEMFKI
jgi:hypothetical protein